MSKTTIEDLKSLIKDEKKEIFFGDGKSVTVRGLTLAERSEVRELSTIGTDVTNIDSSKFQLFAIVKGTIEPKLDLIDIAWIENLPLGIIDKWVGAIYEMSGIGNVDLKKKD